MKNQQLKWGILGAARVNERLLPAIIEASNSQLVAIASRRAGAAKATLEKYAANYDGYVDLKIETVVFLLVNTFGLLHHCIALNLSSASTLHCTSVF